MKTIWRAYAWSGALSAALGMAPLAAAGEAAAVPGKSMRIVAPAAPGGILDLTSRYVGDRLSKAIGQPVIVENRPGAGGILGVQHMLRAEPDGTTLVMGSLGPNAANYSLYADLPYRQEELAPVVHVLSMPNVVVLHPSITATTIDELREHARKKAGGLSMAVSTAGSSGHLAGELFKREADIPAVNIVYRGAAPALVDLVGGQVDIMVDNLITALPLIRDGKLRALAVTSPERSAQLPDVPTMQELGLKDFSVQVWLGLFASAQTPPETVRGLNTVLQEILSTDEVKQRFGEQGGVPVGGSPEDFAGFVDGERKRWGEVIEAAGIRVE